MIFYRMDAGLTLVADLSHWIAVAETNCDDPDLTQVIEDLAPKCRHIHLRVGYDHGPQVCHVIIDFGVEIHHVYFLFLNVFILKLSREKDRHYKLEINVMI